MTRMVMGYNALICACCGSPMGIVEGDKVFRLPISTPLKINTDLYICGDCMANAEDVTEAELEREEERWTQTTF